MIKLIENITGLLADIFRWFKVRKIKKALKLKEDIHEFLNSDNTPALHSVSETTDGSTGHNNEIPKV